MATERTRKGFQTPEEFEKALREDVSVLAEFDLPLTVLALMIEASWKEDSIRRALDALRTADLVTQPSKKELLVTLPNTKSVDAYVVDRRLCGALSEASFGVTTYRRGERVPTRTCQDHGL
ncbi:MAG TPA: hypothetical protein VNA27_03655 [Rubrobacteraceae bacterium]|nr:hypothetical protein [Rubrobacteraceae bacterium]